MSNDNTLLVTKDPKTAKALREAIMEQFRPQRPWVCVVVEAGDSYRVTVDGPWGTRLPEDDEKKVKAFAKQFSKAVEPTPVVTHKHPTEEN